jgi:DNA-binding PadR family transcriptional regulator
MGTPPGLDREVLLAFWKAHILYHADERPIYGNWVLRELRRHGYDLSPGTIYPLLARLADRGWLKRLDSAGAHARQEYVLTARGRRVLAALREHIDELYREVVLGEDEDDQNPVR